MRVVAKENGHKKSINCIQIVTKMQLTSVTSAITSGLPPFPIAEITPFWK